MGYAMCFGSCCACGKLIGFNPMKVPSVRVNGVREPVCLDCIKAANPLRKAKGLPEIVPDPEAYAPCDEMDLP